MTEPAMSDWPELSPCSIAPGPRRQSLKNAGGCMGVLSQMFQWNRLLGGSNKCISAPDVQTLSTSQKKTKHRHQSKQLKLLVLSGHHPRGGLGEAVSSESATSQLGILSFCKESDGVTPQIDMDLRQVLHAKQEPFVLQDVIRDKRQPKRSQSSRELKFVDDGMIPTSRRSPKMKNSTVKDQVQGEDMNSCCHKSAACSSHSIAPLSSTSSVAVVKRNRAPAESMVAMPSYHAPAVSGMQSSKKARSKVASPGRNPVKSPNKRALLMEAAAKILEGSNRRIPKPSVRCLLQELEQSEQEQELSKPKEKLVRAFFLHRESSEEEEVLSQNVAIHGEKVAKIKQHQQAQHQQAQDFKFTIKQTNGSSCKNHLEVSQCLEKDLLIMQSRVFPYKSALDEAEVSTTVTTPAHSHNIVDEYVQWPDVHWSGMEETQNKFMNQIGMEGSISKLSKVQPKLGFATELPEVINVEKHQEPDYSAFTKESTAIVRSTSLESAKVIPFTFNTCLPNFNIGNLPLFKTFLDNSLVLYDAALLLNSLPVDNIACGIDAGRTESSGTSSKLCAGESLIAAADVVVHTCLIDLQGAGHVKTDTNTSNRFVDTDMLNAAEGQNSIPRLCNYSWWASRENNSPAQAVENGENRFSNECIGHDSPTVAAAKGPVVKVFERREANLCEEEASISSSYSCVEEFQQSSPVSVLELVYEEEPGDSFDCFDEARQKLLENVRRYEMLAHMDLDTLMKVSKEHFGHAWDDTNLNESWETDSSGTLGSPNEHSPSSVSGVEAQDSMESYNDPYVIFPEETRYGLSFHPHQDFHMQDVPTSDCSFAVREKVKPRRRCKVVLDCLGEASELDALRDPRTHGEVGCYSGIVVANALVRLDLTSNWSDSGQEGQEVEMELESTLFRILMCELLSDLLQQN